MTDPSITNVFAKLLELRGVSYSPNKLILVDLGLDSQDLVGLILEFERILDQELDDSMILMFAQSPLSEISERLSRLVAEKGAGRSR
jgi:acyl carrier protein